MSAIEAVILPGIAVAPMREKRDLAQKTQREEQWYAGFPVFETNTAILEAVRAQRLVAVAGDGNVELIGRFRNPDLHGQFPPYLLRGSRDALQSLGSFWRNAMHREGLDPLDEVRLAVTSLVRSGETQRKLVADTSKLANPKSTHRNGAAFDIDASAYYMVQHGELISVQHPDRDQKIVRAIGKTLAAKSAGEAARISQNDYDPKVMQVLLHVVSGLHRGERINRIVEYEGTANQCVHIAPNPNLPLQRSTRAIIRP
jgi:Family of unknown function (DUF5715)